MWSRTAVGKVSNNGPELIVPAGPDADPAGPDADPARFGQQALELLTA